MRLPPESKSGAEPNVFPAATKIVACMSIDKVQYKLLVRLFHVKVIARTLGGMAQKAIAKKGASE